MHDEKTEPFHHGQACVNDTCGDKSGGVMLIFIRGDTPAALTTEGALLVPSHGAVSPASQPLLTQSQCHTVGARGLL